MDSPYPLYLEAASSGLMPILSTTTPSICTLSGNNLSLLTVGSCKITASQSGNSTYSPVSVSVSIEIIKEVQYWSGYLPKISVGSPDVSLKTTTSSGLVVSFTSNTPTVCTVVNGVFHAVSRGDCSVSVSQNGNDKIASYFEVFTTAVTLIDQVTVNRTFMYPKIYVGQSLDLSVGVTTLSGKSPLFTLEYTRACYFSGSTIRGLELGSCNVRVSVSAHDEYFGDFKYITVNVIAPPLELLSNITIKSVPCALANSLPNCKSAVVGSSGTYSRTYNREPLPLSFKGWYTCDVGMVFSSKAMPAIGSFPGQCQQFMEPTWVPRSDFSTTSGGYKNYTTGIPGLPIGQVVVAIAQGSGTLTGQSAVYSYAIWEYPK
jgi:hypothetical protein